MMEAVLPSPPRTAPGTSEALKRMTMVPAASPLSAGSGGKGSSREGHKATSPGVASVRSAGRRWRRLHEQCMMEKLMEMRQQKKEHDRLDKENARKMARKIPVELLAKEWLKENEADVDVRAYLVDKVLPTLILGCEKLLTEVDKRGLAEREEVEPNFNPINFLAKYLMRNNPVYSNFSEASPYVRGLREVSEQLRKELFKIEDNRLARIKADVKRRQEERAKQEELRQVERVRRLDIFMKQFVDWTDGIEERLELTLVQSALRSFAEVIASYPEELRAAAQFSHPLEPTDESGIKVNVKEFSKYLQQFTADMPTDIFDQFLTHLGRCATAYRDAVNQEERRIILTNLFNSCDHSGIGLLDRHRVLQLFEQFWDGAREPYKSKLQNPRRWPVVEVEEAEEGYSEEEFDVSMDLHENKEDTKKTAESSTATMGNPVASLPDTEHQSGYEIKEEAIAVETDIIPNQKSTEEQNKENDELHNYSESSSTETVIDSGIEKNDVNDREKDDTTELTTTHQSGVTQNSKTDNDVSVEERPGEEKESSGYEESPEDKTSDVDKESSEDKEPSVKDKESSDDKPPNINEKESSEDKEPNINEKDSGEDKEPNINDKDSSEDKEPNINDKESGHKKELNSNDKELTSDAKELNGDKEPTITDKDSDKGTENDTETTKELPTDTKIGSEPSNDDTAVVPEESSVTISEAGVNIEGEGRETTSTDNEAFTRSTENGRESTEVTDGENKDQSGNPSQHTSHAQGALVGSVHVPDSIPEAGEEGTDEDTKPSQSNTGPGSVSFADGTVYEREKTGLSITSCSQSQASAFDECSLNVSQFVQLTETFLNERPPKDLFELLTKYLKEQYMETEEEKLKRLVKARQEAISAKRKLMINNLFEKWDNDGSGYLDQDEVESVMLLYKDGQEAEAIHRACDRLKQQSQYVDVRLSKREFRDLLEMIVEDMPGPDSFDNFVEFLTNSVERSFAERIRGEARKKWLQQIVTAGETGGSSMEPIYRAVFQALYKDAESHGGGKRISANIAMLEKNTTQRSRGDLALRYVACTPEDADCVLEKILYQDMPGVSFAAVETGKPIHVPRVSNHGNIQFWDAERTVKEGSFIVVPLKDRRKRVFGLMGIDTLNDPHSKAIFITHEIQFFQGVAKAFSIAYHHVDIRKKLLRITESAISWIYRRSPHMNEITMYLVEPDGKELDYVLRKMMTTDPKGAPHSFEPPPKLERKDNLFRDYLFKCVDNSETISADAYGERHLAIPLRNEVGRAVAIVDIGIGELKKLPAHENREVQRMLKLLQMAHREITKELAGEEKTMVLEVEKDEDTRVDVMFDRLMLMELRENVSKLDSRSYSELRSYNEPPRVVQDILKAVLSIFYLEQAETGEFDDWTNVKSYINADLSQKIAEYDPTASEVLIPAEKVMDLLKDVPHGAVTKHGSVPAQHMYNWVFVCLSLIEHTRKMRENSQGNVLADNNEDTDAEAQEGENPARDEGEGQAEGEMQQVA